ncbi:hypothetical protein BAE44_0014328 [Dichanthelium oligosanthes]|uniref:Uncharacterized protein n=1 Tax=Dichanthelium oligosanthes TaxID=888268 RepID=A0A1E5VHP6_9POAL|nr:hypothetical protein BAE44_0014328 [Dichanthelium oligosanthes]
MPLESEALPQRQGQKRSKKRRDQRIETRIDQSICHVRCMAHRSISPAEKHDNAAADDVELGPLLPERSVQLPHLLHLACNLHRS